MADDRDNVEEDWTRRGLSRYQNPAVRRMAFVDRIEPMPIHGAVDDDAWGTEAVVPRDTANGIEDSRIPTETHEETLWSYWGGDVIREEDTYHMFVARWPQRHGHHPGWQSDSRVVRATATDPTGPFTVEESILSSEEPTGETGEYGHNPEIVEVDGTYGLFLGHSPVDLLTAPLPTGPWDRHTIELRGGNSDGGFNPAATEREDGSIVLINRNSPYEVYLADTLTGPYEKVNEGIFPKNAVRVEDPALWRTENQYHLLANEWSERHGFYMRSPDGIVWTLEDPSVAFHPDVTRYTDGTETRWYKLERPKVLIEDGVATHLYLAAIDVPKNEDRPGTNHNSKTLALPLLGPTAVTIQSTDDTLEFGSDASVVVRVSDDDVDVDSLRFGSPTAVNYGRGAAPLEAVDEDDELLVTFRLSETELTSENFVGKIVGETDTGRLVFGFDRLPNGDSK